MSKVVNAVILAAGKGTRMQSSLPKVLHSLGGKSLLQHSVDNAKQLGCDSINIVIGHGSTEIQNQFKDPSYQFCFQKDQLGTGHAVAQAIPGLSKKGVVLVLYGDVPLLKNNTLKQLIDLATPGAMSLLTCVMEKPAGLGRIIRSESGEVIGIVEEKDATDSQKEIKEINTGIMVMPTEKLAQWLPRLSSENAQGEYYLTDVIALAASEGVKIRPVVCADTYEVSGVNDRVQLAMLERHYQKLLAENYMAKGVTISDPSRVDFRGDIKIGRDVNIDVNVILEGNVEIDDGVTIGPNCVIKNSRIGKGSTIDAFSHIEMGSIDEECIIGPFARIRPGTELKRGVKIGNFVETKNAIISEGSKINHLSYIGDSELGKGVNIGAGTITCNYDGVNKYKTIIGDNVFIGSNSALVAPVNIAEGATIGAGSVITESVDEKQLSIARGTQTNIDGWQRPEKK